MASNDERVEIRVPKGELRLWQEAAAAANQNLSEWIRVAARGRISPASQLLAEVWTFIHDRREVLEAPDQWTLSLTHEDERVLAKAGNSAIGPLTSTVMIEGVRAAFPRLFGVKIEWGARNQTLAPNKKSAS